MQLLYEYGSINEFYFQHNLKEFSDKFPTETAVFQRFPASFNGSRHETGRFGKF